MQLLRAAAKKSELSKKLFAVKVWSEKWRKALYATKVIHIRLKNQPCSIFVKSVEPLDAFVN